MNQQSDISRAAAGKGPEEGCVQELRPALPTLALPPELTSGLRRELTLLTLFTEGRAFKPSVDPEGPMPGCAPESPGPPIVLSPEQTLQRVPGNLDFFLIRTFGGVVFVVVYVAMLGLRRSVELHCILQDIFLFSSNVASPTQRT